MRAGKTWQSWHEEEPASRQRVTLLLALLALALLLFHLCSDHAAHDDFPLLKLSDYRERTNGDYKGRETYARVFSMVQGRSPPLVAKKGAYTPVRPASVCVLSADSRPLDMGWQEDGRLPMGTASLLSQLSWSFLHGYQYRRLRTNSSWTTEAHWYTWDKLPPLLDAVRNCQWTVFMDSDVFVNEPSWSLDGMRQSWGIHDDASIFTANDPPRSHTLKSSNTGFMIIQRTAKSITALEKILSCPEDIAECSVYRTQWAHEQTAFELFIAHRYFKPGIDHIRGSCEEANGFWAYSGALEHTCAGSVVAHPWAWKSQVSKSIQRLYGLDMLRALLPLLDSKRSPFAEQADRPSSADALIAQLLGRTESSSPNRVCVLTVDGRRTDKEIRRTRDGWPLESDGVNTASLLQLAFALRHGYEYRRIMLPAFAHYDLHGSWRAIEPLLQTVRVCDTTLFFASGSYPVELDVSVEALRTRWRVPSDAELVLFSQSAGSSTAAFDFALIRSSSKSLDALQRLFDCQADELCLNVSSHNEYLNPEHLSVVWNEVIAPTLPASKMHLVTPCTRGDTHACNSQISTPISAEWYSTIERYTKWSDNVARETVELLGKQVMEFLLETWSSFRHRHTSYTISS